MKAITITQPWATLVAIGAKRYETRGWKTAWRGRLAIHAAKGFPGWAKELVTDGPSYDALVAGGLVGIVEELPLGAVIATAELVDIRRVEDVRDGLDERERAFGNYDDGRFAWELREVRMLPVPVAARGALSLWEWNGGPSQL